MRKKQNNKSGTAVKAMDKVAHKLEKEKLSIQEIEKQFGDGQPYERLRLENEVRFYQQTAAESLIEIGKRLFVIKAYEQHGGFLKVLDNLGMAERSARYAMEAARKFGNRQTFADLGHSKILALTVLDDDAIQSLEDGGEVAGVTIDEIEKMSVRELKDALREERKKHQHAVETREKAIKQKEMKINELDEQLRFQKPLTEKEKKEKAAEAELKKLQEKLFAAIHLAQFHFGDALKVIATARQLEGVTFPMLEKWAKEEYEEIAGFNELFEQLDEELNYISVDKGNGKRS